MENINTVGTDSKVTNLNADYRRFLVYFTQTLLTAIAPQALVSSENGWKLSFQTQIPGLDMDTVYQSKDAAFNTIVTTLYGQFVRTQAAA